MYGTKPILTAYPDMDAGDLWEYSVQSGRRWCLEVHDYIPGPCPEITFSVWDKEQGTRGRVRVYRNFLVDIARRMHYSKGIKVRSKYAVQQSS